MGLKARARPGWEMTHLDGQAGPIGPARQRSDRTPCTRNGERRELRDGHLRRPWRAAGGGSRTCQASHVRVACDRPRWELEIAWPSGDALLPDRTLGVATTDVFAARGTRDGEIARAEADLALSSGPQMNAAPPRHLAAVHVEPRVRDLPGRHPAIAHVGRRDAPEAGGAGLPHHHPQLAVQDVECRLDAGLPERG